MPVTASQMVTLLESALYSSSPMASMIRLADGESVSYRSRIEVIRELEYWRARVNAEGTSADLTMGTIERGDT